MIRRAQTRRGFLLLTVLMMIAVASLILARVANSSMRVATTAMTEEREMRQRWASYSMRRFALSEAPGLLQDVDSSDVPSTLWRDIRLAGEDYRVIVSDESAKLNVLRVAGENDLAQAIESLKRLSTGAIGIRPNGSQAASHRPMTRWDDWFDVDSYTAAQSNRGHVARELATSTQRVTLWGNGRLNVSRCDGETIDLLWNRLFGRPAPSALHQARGQSPPMPWVALSGQLGLRESQIEKATSWIQTDSDCWSVWVFCESDRRVPPTFYVEWGRGGNQTSRGYVY
ncbi:MAG: hypothetical protein AAFX06_17910 [Planctomycetota bacterium]